MKQYAKGPRRRRGERGQVLILAVVALILVIIAVLLLFDVQTVIRGKIKAQNGVDAAALTGAEWQKHSLNLIGELNLIRATGTLISDPYFESAILETYKQADEFFFSEEIPIRNRTDDFLSFPELEKLVVRDENNEVVDLNRGLFYLEANRVEREMFYLDSLDRLVSQLQTRISFVGPLIGFGAAQQAAKNNGITFDSEASDSFIEYVNRVAGNDEDEGDIYEQFTPGRINDYQWRIPYVSMLESILDYSAFHNDFTGETENRAYGIAVGIGEDDFEYLGTPSLVTNPPTDLSVYLGNKHFYEMIHARDWCGLDPLLRLDFNGNWWGDFECDYNYDFSNQSEILPLHISFSYDSPEDSNERTPYSKSTAPFHDAEDYMGRYTKGRDLLTRTYRDDMSPYRHGYRHTYEEMEPDEEGKKDTQVTVETSPFAPFPVTRANGAGEMSDADRINTWDILFGNNDSFSQEDFRRFINKFLETYNEDDSDLHYTPLPVLSWALFDEEWTSFGPDKDEWENYLRGGFKPGMDYRSGALSHFAVAQDTVTISGSMGRPRHGNRAPDVGQVFSNTAAGSDARGVSHALGKLNSNSVERLTTDAKAKPIGRIKTKDGQYLRPFEAGRMVLPIFTETALIPVPLESLGGGSMYDKAWGYYLKEFVPLLSGSPSIQDAWERAVDLAKDDPKIQAHLGYYAYYVSALAMLSNPEFRQAGLDWLDAPAVWTKDEHGNRIPMYTNREYNCTGRQGEPGGNGGWSGTVFSKGGPSKLH